MIIPTMTRNPARSGQRNHSLGADRFLLRKNPCDTSDTTPSGKLLRVGSRYLQVFAAGLALAGGALTQAGGLSFDGVDDYVTMGTALGLGTQSFTLECWVQHDPTGTGRSTANSGTGGINIYPLIGKGRGEGDGSNVDCNYTFGLQADGRLAADFEDYNSGLNHPIVGTNVVPSNVWKHCAVTYDGSYWKIYIDGVLDNSLQITGGVNVQVPRYDSIQHFGLGTAMTSTGTAQGFYKGLMDEVRVWNYARTQAQIAGSMNSEITSATGLIGRWSLNETSGTTAANTGTSAINGTLVNGPLWSSSSPGTPGTAPVTLLSQNFSTDPVNYTLPTGSDFRFDTSIAGSRYWALSNTPGLTVNAGITDNTGVYLATQNIDGGSVTFSSAAPAQIDFTVAAANYTGLKLSIALAGMPTAEDVNFIRAKTDNDGDGTYETTLFEFKGSNNSAYVDNVLGTLTAAFQTFSNIALPAPTAADGKLRLRLESFNDTDSQNEATGIDTILISGRIPNPNQAPVITATAPAAEATGIGTCLLYTSDAADE